jgi:hypothetical protein
MAIPFDAGLAAISQSFSAQGGTRTLYAMAGAGADLNLLDLGFRKQTERVTLRRISKASSRNYVGGRIRRRGPQMQNFEGCFVAWYHVPNK